MTSPVERAAHAVLERQKFNTRDPFQVLGNPRDLKEARQAYRRLALVLHPDKCVNSKLKALCEEAFKVVNNAFKRIQSEYGSHEQGQVDNNVEDDEWWTEWSAEPTGRPRTTTTATTAACEKSSYQKLSADELRRAKGTWENLGGEARINSLSHQFLDEKDIKEVLFREFREPAASEAMYDSVGNRRRQQQNASTSKWWDDEEKENKPCSVDQVRAARSEWSFKRDSIKKEMFTLNSEVEPREEELASIFDALKADDLANKRSLAKSSAAKVIKAGIQKGISKKMGSKKRKKIGKGKGKKGEISLLFAK